MQNLKFRRLQILSHSQKSGNQFTFSEGLNLITANDNSLGKSTLAKLLYWGLGCDPVLDTVWKKLECKTIIELTIAGTPYTIARDADNIVLKDNQGVVNKYNKISGPYASMLADLVGFNVLLPNQTSQALEVPPPAYYFLPFYIDQIKGWGTPWDSFDKLRQYSAWKEKVVKYHVGMLNPEYFENEQLISDKKSLQKSIDQAVIKLDSALEVVSPYINSNVATIDADELERMNHEISVDLKGMADKQEQILDNLSKLRVDKSNIEHQAIMVSAAVSVLEKDYVFAVENLAHGTFSCPLCGTEHDNSAMNRASILSDKNEAAEELDVVESLIIAIDIKIKRAEQQLAQVREDMVSINDRYIIQDNKKPIELNQIINTIAAKSIHDDVTRDKGAKITEAKDTMKQIKALEKSRRSIVSKEQTDKIIEDFIVYLSSFSGALNAETIDLSQIKSPSSFNAVFKQGGAAESIRRILAYYLAIFSTINKHGNEVVCALTIDTPNQQEQTIINYDRIVKLLINDMPEDAQIILCALDNPALEPFKSKAKVIMLTSVKLLDKNQYEELTPIFEELGF